MTEDSSQRPGPRFLTATLNSALDRLLQIEEWVPGQSMRGPEIVDCPGGKGMDTAITLRSLCLDVTAVVNLAGAPGRRTLELGEAYGMDVVPVWVDGRTRESHVVIETRTGLHSHLMSGAIEVSQTDLERFIDALDTALPGAAALVAAGSVPPGLPDDIYGRIAELARAHHVPCIVDCSGAPLAAAARSHCDVLKCNDDEYKEAFGVVAETTDDLVADLVERVRTFECDAMVLTCGADGLVAASDLGVVRAQAPRQQAVNAAGAGDATSAAIAWRLGLGESWPEIVRWAAAVSAASVLTFKTAEVEPGEVERLLPQVTVTTVA